MLQMVQITFNKLKSLGDTGSPDVRYPLWSQYGYPLRYNTTYDH